MKNLNEEIKKAIEANLPAQISKVLQERLSNVDSLVESLKVKEKQIAARDKSIEKLEGLKWQGDELTKWNRELSAKEKELDKRELRLEVDTLKSKLASSERSRNDIYNLAQIVFKSVKPTYDLFGNANYMDPSTGISMNPTINGTIQEQEE